MSTRWALIISVIVVCSIALIIFIGILIKVFLIKREIKKNNKNWIEKELLSPGHQKVIEREDLYEIDFNLKSLSKSLVSDETIEFCINSIIKNLFQNVLICGKNNIYEIISISQKTKINLYVEEVHFDSDQYLKIIKRLNYENKNNIIYKNEKIQYDAILILQPDFNFLKYYNDNINLLKIGGMMIIANIDKNKKNKKELLKKLRNSKNRFDVLKWDCGFFIIVKE
ncbi:MAG: BC85_0335 family putative methyltransferase [Metamycoplasmataceae bacterium]